MTMIHLFSASQQGQ